MSRHYGAFTLIIISIPMIFMLGCPKSTGSTGNAGQTTDEEGRYIFDEPSPITQFGTFDTPRLAADPTSGKVHMVFLLHDVSSERVMYTSEDNGEFSQPALLSQTEGRKSGGAFIMSPAHDNLIAYWINVAATAGQLRYKTSDNGGRTWTMESRWNDRNEVRWPCVLKIRDDIVAYFFVQERDTWDLAINRNFSDEDEPTILTIRDTPYNLQGFADNKKVWLAFYVREGMSDGGRIALLTSNDDGNTFDSRYMFDDRIIINLVGFFRMVHTTVGRDSYIHLIFTESESEDLTTLYYSRSDDGGATFSTPVALFNSEIILTQSPLLIANGGNVFIATADADDDGPALRYVFSDDSGDTFTDPAVATRNVSSPETFAGVMRSNASVLIVWDDISPESEGDEQLYSMIGNLSR
jgi:hypothetical protein